MLKGYIAPSQSVPIPGNDPIVIRGLSLHDIAALVKDFRLDIDSVFKQFDGLMAGRGLPDLDIGAVVTVSMQTAPRLVSAIIARAAGEPDEVDAVALLPLVVQLSAIEAVGQLTFEGEGGAKNVWEAVLRLIGGVGGLVNRKVQPSRQAPRIGKDGMPTSDPE